MTHGSLFSGIGGFDLAAEWMGWENKFHCEKDKFCNQILNYYWPNATPYKDIRTTDFTIWGGQIDVLSGGFPCQPYSVAGKRKGKDDDRHLWPEMLRAIREIQPRWVVGENVRGLINWNGGLVFDEVQSDLEAAGYEVLPFLLPAAGINAPHRRDRVWFVSYSGGFNRSVPIQQRGQDKAENFNVDREGSERFASDTAGVRRREDTKAGMDKSRKLLQNRKGNESSIEFVGTGEGQNVADAQNIGQERAGLSWSRGSRFKDNNKRDVPNTGSTGRKEFNVSEKSTEQRYGSRGNYAQPTDWQDFPTQSPVCSGNDELSARLDGITFSKWRNESIKAYGNAVVPELVLQIFKTIEQYDNL